MDNDQRRYCAVSLDCIGIEDGTKRFTQDGVTTMPPVARWRNNLTVMSQRDNLFFAASGDCVAVYQPDFPYQTLKRNPALLIRPDLARPDALGYMSQHALRMDAHYINHLVVGELGSQEILLLATDSGNIAAYYTAAIQRAIDLIERNGLTNRFGDGAGLQPFFKHWVYQSAWGLDIHKEARMIAVSSNVPTRRQPIHEGNVAATITVFAFALTDTSSETEEDSDDEVEAGFGHCGDDTAYDDDDDDDDDDEEDDDDHEDTLDAEWTLWNTHRNAERPERTKNYKVVLKGDDGHINNIPNVCFVNSSEDSEGIWLLSTDITGIMKLWQIWRGSCLRQWDFSNDNSRIDDWLHTSYPGWNVVTLDVNAFRPVRTQIEFIGAERAPIHYGYHDQGASFNLTSIARQVPGNSRFHPSHADFSDSGDDSDADQIIDGNELDEDTQLEESNSRPANGGNLASAPLSNAPMVDMSFGESEALDLQHNEIPLEFEYEEETISDYDSRSDESDEEDDQDSAEESFAISPPANRRVSEIRSKVRPFQLPKMPMPEIAMIHCSNSSIRMLGSPKARYPHIFCANIVRQTLPEHLLNTIEGAELQAMERLNMIQKIPELGILLIATQAGRVAVCSLTRKEDLLGFRVDGILPTKKQERSGQRPGLCTLIGMAVAPIQTRPEDLVQYGHNSDELVSFEDGIIDGVKTTFDPKVVVLRNPPSHKERHAQKTGYFCEPTVENKPWRSLPRDTSSAHTTEGGMRYRIMLTYTDLSVLTYEISRNVEKSYARR